MEESRDGYLERLGVISSPSNERCVIREHVTDPLTLLPVVRTRYVTVEYYNKYIKEKRK